MTCFTEDNPPPEEERKKKPMPIKDDGPAFPLGYGSSDKSYVDGLREGMSLRDFFASQAILVAFENNGNFKLAASECYRFADAMLKEREK